MKMKHGFEMLTKEDFVITLAFLSHMIVISMQHIYHSYNNL